MVCACWNVIVTSGVKASITLFPEQRANWTTAPRRQDLKILFLILEDIILDETWIEVSKIAKSGGLDCLIWLGFTIQSFWVPAPLGSIPELPAETCKEIKASEGGQAVSGKYWFDSIIPERVVLAHCDMNTEGKWKLKSACESEKCWRTPIPAINCTLFRILE